MYNMYKCVFDRPKNKLVAFVTMTACCTQVPRGKTKKKKKQPQTLQLNLPPRLLSELHDGTQRKKKTEPTRHCGLQQT